MTHRGRTAGHEWTAVRLSHERRPNEEDAAASDLGSTSRNFPSFSRETVGETFSAMKIAAIEVAGVGMRGGRGRMPNAKSIGWAIYAAGFVIWLFGYLSPGHAAAFDWDVVAPSWISSFVPNLEAEFGLALMFASMIPIYWRAGRKRP